MAKDVSATDAAFAARFLKASDQNPHCPDKNFGRYGWIAQQLYAKGITVSNESIRKWFHGESRPTIENVTALADILKVDLSWLQFGVDSQMAAKEQKARNAEADGSVNLIAGLIQSDGGAPAFPAADDLGALNDHVDLYAVIRGAKYAFHVVTGNRNGEKLVFNVPTNHENVVLIGVIREGFSVQVYELTEETVTKFGASRRGASFAVTAPAAELKQITSFASRL